MSGKERIIDRKGDVMDFIDILSHQSKSLTENEISLIIQLMDEYLEDIKEEDSYTTSKITIDEMKKDLKNMHFPIPKELGEELLQLLKTIYEHYFPFETTVYNVLKKNYKHNLYHNFSESSQKEILEKLKEKAKSYVASDEELNSFSGNNLSEIIKEEGMVSYFKKHKLEDITENDIASFNEDEKFEYTKNEPKIDSSRDTAYLLLNFPITDKAEKMKAFVKKKLLKGTSLKEENIISLEVPVDAETKKTKGIAFVEFDEKLSKSRKQELNGILIQKGNPEKKKKELKLKVHSFKEMLKAQEDSKKDYSFKAAEFKPQPNLMGWLKHPFSDQFLTFSKKITEISWNNPIKGGGESILRKNFKNDDEVNFSSQGTYLVTRHKKGYALWAGDEFTSYHKLIHPYVCDIEWSPSDTFAITFSKKEDELYCKLWDVRMKRLIREQTIPHTAVGKPTFHWTPDEAYYALLDSNAGKEEGSNKKKEYPLRVYSTKNFKHDPHEAWKVKGIQKIRMAPCLNNKGHALLAYYMLSNPNRVVLVNVTTKTEFRFKNVYNSMDANMLWHPNSHYFAVACGTKKNNNSIANSIDIFHIKEKSIPIETLHFQQESIKSMSFEPTGNRLAVITELSSDPSAVSVGCTKILYIYDLSSSKARLISTIDNISYDTISWSPSGGQFVIYQKKSMNGEVQFWHCGDKNALLCNTIRHYQASRFLWDPTGRYLATVAVGDSRSSYRIYNVIGKLLYEKDQDQLQHFCWRPRRNYLSKGTLRKLEKKLPSKIKKYEKEERERLEAENQKSLEKYQKMWDDFKALEARHAEIREKERLQSMS